MDPLVSICCITYNHEAYIEEAIEGFLLQKTDFPFEILIHDDASQDKTPHILKKHELKDDRISVIYQKDNKYSKGEKPFLKYLFPRARGKYIAICEGDDYWTDPSKLQKQFDIMENNSAISLCFHDTEILRSKENILFSKLYHNKLVNPIGINDILRSKWLIPTNSVLFRNNILEYPKVISEMKAGDFGLCCFILTKGEGYYIEETLSCYRKTNESSFTNARFILENIYVKTTNTKFLIWLNEYTNYSFSTEINSRMDRNLDQINNYTKKYLSSKGFKIYWKTRKTLEFLKILR